MEEGVLKETDFRLDHFPADYDKERIARTLAPLNHLQNLKSSIPDSVTFMEMYGAETFEDCRYRAVGKRTHLTRVWLCQLVCVVRMTWFSSICMKKPMDLMD